MKQQTFKINTPAGKQTINRQQFYFGSMTKRYRQLYKGRTIEVKEYGLTELLARLKYMHDAGMDLSPVWADVIDEHQRTIQGGFKARQSPDTPPQRWVKLSKRYAKWKYRTHGSRLANLILRGDLKRAVWGGSGWFETISQKSAKWGIDLPHAAVHQYGSKKKNIPQRNYFLPKNGQLPQRVVTMMIDRTEKYLTGAA